MTQEVQIVLKVKDLKDESGNNLIFNITFKQLVLMLIKAVHAMANDHDNPIRLYASNANTALALLLNAMGEDVEEPERVDKKTLKKGEYGEIIGAWRAKYRGKKKPQKIAKGRKKRVVGKRPPDAQLLEFRKNGALYKDIAKLYGVEVSTVGVWFKKIK